MAARVEEEAARLFRMLSGAFPVCSASDEFHYFPQVPGAGPDLGRWDDFAPERIREVTGALSSAETRLRELSERPDRSDVSDAEIDIASLKRIASTLREQFEETRFLETQPTFYLTVAGVGLAEALAAPFEGAFQDRASGLPAFLDQAGSNLRGVPALFADLGRRMLEDTGAWLRELHGDRGGLEPALAALDRFGDRIRAATAGGDFRLPGALLDRIVREHIGAGMGPEEIGALLDREIGEATRRLEREAARIDPSRPWQELLASIGAPPLPPDGLIGLYRQAVEEAASHCASNGLVTAELLASCPATVAPVPPYLAAVRSAAAYSMPPGHPPRGGTFYIVDLDRPDAELAALHREYRILSTHETYPGHHLLDASRWGLGNPVRRAIEYPLFYEGWACFAEEIMLLSGFVETPADRMLLARRNLWRAVRGRLDLDLNTGRIDLDEAAARLIRSGVDARQAAEVAPRYALKPGYQLSYTLGQRRFSELFERYADGDLCGFCRTVLACGEIGFPWLARRLAAVRGKAL